MKILFISNVIPIKHNGPTKHILSFIKSVKNNNIDILSFNYPFKHKNKIKDFLFYLYSLFIIVRYGSNRVVYIRYFPLCSIQLILCKIINAPIFIEYNSIIEDEINIIYPKLKFLKQFIKFNSKLSSRLSDGIITLSKGINKYIQNSYRINNEKILVSNNGAYIHNIKKEEFNKRGLTAIGEMPWYNINALIRIKEILEKQGIVFDIYVSSKHINNKYKDKIIYNCYNIDFTKYDWGLVYLDKEKAKDKFIYGVNPIKFFEFLSYGIVPIIPDLDDINSIVKEFNNGYIYYNDNDIINIIKNIYKDKELFIEQSQRSMYIIKEYYNWDKLIKHIINFMESKIERT